MELKLPEFIASKRDIIRMQRIIERYQEQYLQRRISKDTAGVDRPAPSLPKSIDALFHHNELEITDENLTSAHESLESIKENAPIIRISFANEPDDEATKKIVGWFRREVEPSLIVQIGVQPMIAGGCVVHTGPNRYDFSIREALLGSVPKFVENLNRSKG